MAVQGPAEYVPLPLMTIERSRYLVNRLGPRLDLSIPVGRKNTEQIVIEERKTNLVSEKLTQ